MAVVRKITGRSRLPYRHGVALPETPVAVSLEERVAYLRRRRKPDWLVWTLTTIGVIAMLGWLVAEAVGLFQSA